MYKDTNFIYITFCQSLRRLTWQGAIIVPICSPRFTVVPCLGICVWVSLTLKVLGATIDAQWEGLGDVGSARYKPALLRHARP